MRPQQLVLFNECRLHAIANECIQTIDGQLQMSLQPAIQPSILAANLQCMSLPFPNTAETLRDLSSEITILMAMYLYCHCKPFAAHNHEGYSSCHASNVKENIQSVNPEQDHNVQMILKETTQILGDAGYNPQLNVQDECLDRFCLQRLGFLPEESKNQTDAQTCKPTPCFESNTALSVNLSGTDFSKGHKISEGHKNLTEVLATALITDPSDSLEQEDGAPPSKRRRLRHDQNPNQALQ